MTENEQFLTTLFGNKPPEHWIHFWTKTQSYFTQSIPEAVTICHATQDRDIWIGCGTRNADMGQYERGKYIDIAGIPGLWLDVDILGPGHKDTNLPPDHEAAITLLNSQDIPPTIIINSGHGLQGWWLFDQFLTFRDAKQRDTAGSCARAFVTAFQSAGYHIDPVGDLPRILRVPGTINHKSDPVPVTILSNDGPRYKPAQFKRFLVTSPQPSSMPSTTSWTPKTTHATIEQLKDPQYWLSRALDKTNDGTRHDHGVWLACMLRDNCAGPGVSPLSACEAIIGDFSQRNDDDPTDPYTQSEINSMLRILSEPGREPSWAPLVTAKIVKTVTASTGEVIEEVHLTDLGNAQRLIAKHGKDIRCVYAQGYWLVWDGSRWAKDNTGTIQALAVDTVRGMYSEGQALDDAAARKSLVLHAVRSESNQKLGAMVSLAQHLSPITEKQLDADPWLLSCGNGVLDLKTGELLEPMRENYITRGTPVYYDAKAQSPIWDRFLDRIMPDPDIRAYLQRAVGYTLTGDVREQCFFFLFGSGANGKSTFIETIALLAGDYYEKLPIETFSLAKYGKDSRRELATLPGARFASVAEMAKGTKLDEGLLKELTGGDTVTARLLRQEQFNFKCGAKLWFFGNHKPEVSGRDQGIWRRTRLIPFTIQIPEAEWDLDLKDKLKDELPGILAWAVQGTKAWRKHKLSAPQVIIDATNEYRVEQDTLADFLAAHCYFDRRARVSVKELREVYRQFIGFNEMSTYEYRAFDAEIRNRDGVQSDKGHSNKATWIGIGLRDDAPVSTTDDLWEAEEH